MSDDQGADDNSERRAVGTDSANADRRRTAGDQSSRSDLPGPLLEVLADPAQGQHRLPFLLGLLDGDDPELRLTAGTAVCLVVETQPDLCGYAVGRLVDRLGDDAPVEVAHTLDYLAARRPKAVDRAVSDLDDAAERVARERMYQTGAGFARSDYLAPSDGDRASGRVRMAGETTDQDPRRVYSDDGDATDRREGAGAAAAGVDDDGDTGADPDIRGDSTADDGDETDAAAGVETRRDDRRDDVTSGTLALVSKRLSEVIDASRFDDLTVLTERRRGRYGDVYRTAGTVGGDQHAVALTVYRLPETDRAAFAEGLEAAFDDWSDVDDHENVRTVFDWGLQPRPWAALDYTDLTLANRTDEPTDPILTALDLADAVAHAHQHGVVHGALDPRNVAYLDTILDATERRRPLLTNVGLATETGSASPGVGVDPRYAAPEHYDDSFGRVDHATDVYGLGSLLYRLATGTDPYDGDDVDDVRASVLSGDPPGPSETDTDLPTELNQILQKATATQKLRRYETVNHLKRELRAVRESNGA